MNEVNVIVDSADEPFKFKMKDEELGEFLGFTNNQEVTDVFDHFQNGYTFRLFKKHISFVSYKKVG